MATFNANIGAEPARAPRFGGLIARRAKFTVPAGAVAGDIVNFCQLPKGAVVMYGAVTNEAANTTVFDVGFGGGLIDGVPEDPNAYLSASIAAAGRAEFDELAGLLDTDALDAERPLIGTFTTGNPTASAIIICTVAYLLSP